MGSVLLGLRAASYARENKGWGVRILVAVGMWEGRSATSTRKPTHLASQELDMVAIAPDTVSYGHRNTDASRPVRPRT